MKLHYFIPFLGFYFIRRDIPWTEDERPFKPLQGDLMFAVGMGCALSSAAAFAILLYLSNL
jgi:hypothetical protein